MNVTVQMADGTLETLTAEEVATMAHGVISGKDEEIARLRGENERLRAAVKDMQDWNRRCSKAQEKFERERDKALSDVEQYRSVANDALNERDEALALLRELLRVGSHWEGCDTSHEIGHPCTCGYAAAEARAEAFLAGDRQGDSRSAPGSTPDSGTHLDPKDWNPDFCNTRD